MAARTLLLLRHAKSSWDDPASEDIDRPLAKRGRDAAPRMGREMARRGWIPDTALVSSALRTRQTWELVASELPAAVPTVFDGTIYEAPGDRILDAIRKSLDEAKTLLVIGHNPGFEQLALRLASPTSDSDALVRLRQKFPTAALAIFTFDGEWRGLTAARLEAFVTPKDLNSP